MKRSSPIRIMSTKYCIYRYFVAGLVAIASVVQSHAVEVEGFTEPFKTVNVAAVDPGIVMSLPVHVGDFVKKGDVIARLDDDLHTIMLGMAKDKVDEQGRMQAIAAELKMRELRLQNFLELKRSGFGRNEEVERAEMELDISRAELQQAHEDAIQNRWEFKKLDEQLNRRTVRAPMSGFIAETLKEPGEYVSPQEPSVVTMVQLDPLLAKFALPRSMAKRMKLGDKVSVKVGGRSIIGTVDSVTPIIDAQSGTQKVKIRISNPDGQILSGQRCQIDVPYDEDASKGDAKKVAIRRLSESR